MKIKDGFNKLNTGEIDALFIVAGAPVKLLSELPGSVSDKIHLIPFEFKKYKKVSINHFHYKRSSIKAKHYQWLNGDVETIAVVSSIIVNNAMPGSEVSNLIKTIFLNRKTLEEKHPKWKELNKFTIQWYLEGRPQLFHPEARKTLKSMGM